ncbi:hypothetical protein SALBM311S_11406 [Streptomyces alboniger]
MSVSRLPSGLESMLPPPRVRTLWSCAGGSSTLADWSRWSLFCRPGICVTVFAP